MSEVSKGRRALQEGAGLHLMRALDKATQAGKVAERVKLANDEYRGWLAGVEDSMLCFNQFQLSVKEVMESDAVIGEYGEEAVAMVTKQAEVAGRGMYGKETPAQTAARERRNELFDMNEEERWVIIAGLLEKIKTRLEANDVHHQIEWVLQMEHRA